jgi:hypothetical protein
MNFDSPEIRPLSKMPADGRLLQVLIDRLTLRRRDKGGVILDVSIKSDHHSVASNAGKRAVKERLDFDEGRRAIAAIAAFRDDAAESVLDISLERFVFRHASAGVLPILRRGGVDQVALVHRDIEPEGWNIANGASSNFDELADVNSVMTREFAEEFLMIDAAKRRTIEFPLEKENVEIARSRELWAEKLGGQLERAAFDTAWGMGPDALCVTLPDGRRIATHGLYISFNVDDFGIECSRLVRINVPDGFLPADGEMSGDRLLDRPIGIFSTSLIRSRSALPLRLFRGAAENFDPESGLEGRKLAFCPVAHDLLARVAPTT